MWPVWKVNWPDHLTLCVPLKEKYLPETSIKKVNLNIKYAYKTIKFGTYTYSIWGSLLIYCMFKLILLCIYCAPVYILCWSRTISVALKPWTVPNRRHIVLLHPGCLIIFCLCLAGPVMDPMLATCCRAILGCKTCITRSLHISNECVRCRADNLALNLVEVSGLSEALNALEVIIKVD